MATTRKTPASASVPPIAPGASYSDATSGRTGMVPSVSVDVSEMSEIEAIEAAGDRASAHQQSRRAGGRGVP